ncbi:MAG: diguanylate cyclase [Ruminococcaceae bacterium]|nr:diguanylate cyclase [Oscillospiraceae bacterium]
MSDSENIVKRILNTVGKTINRLNLIVANLVLISSICVFSTYKLFVAGRPRTAIAVITVNVIILVTNIIILQIKKKATVRKISQLGLGENDNLSSVPGFVRDFSLPTFFIDEAGKVLWTNSAFDDLCTECNKSKKQIIRNIYGLRIKSRLSLIQNSDKTYEPAVQIGTKHYIMHCNVVDNNGAFSISPDSSYIIMVYFHEITELMMLKDKYDRERVAVGEIVIDDYDEIFQSDGEAVINRVLVEIDRLFENWLSGKGAIIRRLVRDRYIFLIADEHLREIEKGNFSILDSVKKISRGNSIPVTLSIGISAHGENLAKNFKVAQEAVNLALGRGGDQAIVRIQGKDSYYGSSNIELERKNKVKVRIAADMLKKEILKSSRVFVMGHSSADMDSVGACLAVYRIARRFKVKANIILNSSNSQISHMYSELMKEQEYRNAFINESEALNLIDEMTLVVVADTFKKEITEAPAVLDEAERIAVIDHHRKGADYIQNTVLNYSETFASSTSEIMVEILSYLAPDMSIPKIEAEALYAGILVDTKMFAFKTSKRTFEAAAKLKSQGVDTVEARKYFHPDFDSFLSISRIIGTARIIENKIAIASCALPADKARFISSVSADRLLDVSGVEASFVLTQVGDNVSISGRSLGNINVQVILENERFNGGGHLVAAGAFLKDVTVEYAEKQLETVIREYLKK